MKSKRRVLMLLALSLVVVWTLGAVAQTNDAAEDQREIVVWHYTRGDSMDILAEAFEKAHPHIRVELEHMGDFQGENFFLHLAAGAGPDVVWADGTVVTSWAFAGAIQPLTPWIERDGITQDQFIPPAWNQAIWLSDLYALPLYVDANFALLSNMNMLNKIGALPPATIAELDEMFAKLTPMDAEGNITQTATVPWDVHGLANSMFTWGWAFGGSFLDQEAMQVTANDPNIVRALEWMASPAEKFGYTTIHGLLSDLPTGLDSFQAQRVAMRPGHPGLVRSVMDNVPDMELSVTPLPYDDTTVDSPQTWIGGFTLAMSAGARDTDAAWEFIKYATATDEGTAVYSQASGNFPGLLTSPAFHAASFDEHTAYFMDILLTAKHARPVLPNVAFYTSQLNSSPREVLRGEKPATEVLDEITRLVQANLDEALSQSE